MITRIITLLLSNCLMAYGVLFLNWNFFMIIYSYWFSEVISTLFEKWSYHTLKKKGLLPELNGSPFYPRFFMLFIYWFFIVIIAGFITAPSGQYIENLFVIFFRNLSFNTNLLLFIVTGVFYYFNTTSITSENDLKKLLNSAAGLSKRTIVLHMSILLGTFFWFLTNTDKFSFQLSIPIIGANGFLVIFIIIKTIGDLYSFKKENEAPKPKP